ncbi:hypothetical protein B0T25DRAFT_513987 [Lasiosphaeria hispida]|uniref:Uncharacterized protein n=1 Tax=Lasiosphaeria hispida TaxID=260671 RepID=A0AAJ0MKW3_9PEZI|nr:hypothetical protein B0T25DRAFT_513987 [Lasiosphaeria hispida]
MELQGDNQGSDHHATSDEERRDQMMRLYRAVCDTSRAVEPETHAGRKKIAKQSDLEIQLACWATLNAVENAQCGKVNLGPNETGESFKWQEFDSFMDRFMAIEEIFTTHKGVFASIIGSNTYLYRLAAQPAREVKAKEANKGVNARKAAVYKVGKTAMEGQSQEAPHKDNDAAAGAAAAAEVEAGPSRPQPANRVQRWKPVRKARAARARRSQSIRRGLEAEAEAEVAEAARATLAVAPELPLFGDDELYDLSEPQQVVPWDQTAHFPLAPNPAQGTAGGTQFDPEAARATPAVAPELPLFGNGEPYDLSEPQQVAPWYQAAHFPLAPNLAQGTVGGTQFDPEAARATPAVAPELPLFSNDELYDLSEPQQVVPWDQAAHFPLAPDMAQGRVGGTQFDLAAPPHDQSFLSLDQTATMLEDLRQPQPLADSELFGVPEVDSHFNMYFFADEDLTQDQGY